MKKILVTGGSGFIGRELVRKLLATGYEVVAFDLAEQLIRHEEFFQAQKGKGKLKLFAGSILDRTSLRMSMEGVDTVVHLAAMLGVKKTEDNRLGCIEVNINGTENVLNACVMNGVKKVVFASSSEVYGEPRVNPVNEELETQGKTVYAITKMAGEELIKGYHQIYPELNYSIARFFNTYGEGQVAQFVLSRFVKNVMEGKNPVVYGDGKQLRSYGHVDDVTDGVIKMMESVQANGKLYNLGNSSQVISLKDLAQRAIDLLAPQKGLKVEVVGSFEGTDRQPEREIHVRYCDTAKAERDLGYKPKITIDEGIRRIAAFGSIHSDWPQV